MAAKFVEADVEDISQCHVCLLQFCDERIPKFLYCSHTFCLPCLKSIGQGQLRLNCPECRETIDVPQGDPTKLPTNRAALKVAQLQQITKCETCGCECLNNKCFHCGKSICADCVKEHEKNVETEMNKLRNDLQGSLSRIKKFKLAVNDHMESLNKDTENNVQQIEKDYKLLEQALKDRKEQLIEQVKINSSSIHTRHDTVQGIILKNFTDIEALLTDIDGVSDSISSLTKQTIDSIVESSEEAINQMKQTFPNCDIKFTVISCDSKVDSLLRAIENWGSMTPQKEVSVKLTGSPTEFTDGKKQQSPPKPQTSGQLRKHINIQKHTKNTDQPEEYSLLPLSIKEKEKPDFEHQAKQEREAREAAEIGKAEAEKKAERYRIEKETAEKEKTNFEHQAKRERKARDAAERQKAVAEKNAEKYCVEKEIVEKAKVHFEDQAKRESEARDVAERQKAEAEEKAEKYRVAQKAAERGKTEAEKKAETYRREKETAERQKAEAEEKAEEYCVEKEAAERQKAEAEEKAEKYCIAKNAADHSSQQTQRKTQNPEYEREQVEGRQQLADHSTQQAQRKTQKPEYEREQVEGGQQLAEKKRQESEARRFQAEMASNVTEVAVTGATGSGIEKKNAQKKARIAEKKMHEAQTNEKQAEMEACRAEFAKDRAEMEREQADFKRKQAEEDYKKAVTQHEKQEAAKRRAEEEQKISTAESKRHEAEVKMKRQEFLRKLAEKEREQVVQERSEAIKKENAAELERQKAEDEKREAEQRANDIEKKKVKWYNFIPVARPIAYGVKRATDD